MEFKINQSDLKTALNAVSGALMKGKAVGILECVYIESLGERRIRITATDFDLTIKAEADAEIIQGGSVCVEGFKLTEVTRNLPNLEMTFAQESNHWMRVTAGRSKYRLAGRVGTDYPELASSKNPPVTINRDVLRSMIRSTVFTAAQDTPQWNINGVYFESTGEDFRAVATDGLRVALATAIALDGEPFEFLLSKRGASEVSKLESTEIQASFDANHIFFDADGVQLTVRKSTGKFPAYRVMMPKDEGREIASFNIAEMKAALKRAGVMSDADLGTVRLEIAKGEIAIRSQSREEGEADELITAEYDGPEQVLGVRWTHLLQFLETITDGGDALISFKPDSVELFKFTPKGSDDQQYFLVPVQLNVQEKQLKKAA